MLNRYFAPYAEYTLRTKLSEVELRTVLKQKCGCTFANSIKVFLAAWTKREIPLIRLSFGSLIKYLENAKNDATQCDQSFLGPAGPLPLG